MKKLLVFLFVLPVLLSSQTKSIIDFRTEANQNVEFNLPEVEQKNQEKKSVGLAILYSLLLPGMGELYSGNYSAGKYFTIAEGVLWGSYLGTSYYSSYKKDNYMAFAKVNANVTTSGKDNQFWGDIGNYSSIYIYNEEMDLNRNYDLLYDESSHFWEWNSISSRKEYRAMWVSSETAKNSLIFIAGGMVLNRIVSAINAVRLARNFNENLSTTQSYNINFTPTFFVDNSVGLSINFNHRL